MSHHVPYYANAPLGQTTAPAPVPTTSSMVVSSSPLVPLWRIGGVAAGAALAYHGMKRNNGSIGWALVWALAGGIVWPVGLAIAFAQGFAKPAVRANRGRRSRRRR